MTFKTLNHEGVKHSSYNKILPREKVYKERSSITLEIHLIKCVITNIHVINGGIVWPYYKNNKRRLLGTKCVYMLQIGYF